MIYVYALISAGGSPPDGATGLQGSPVEHHARGDVAAAVTRHTSAHIEASVDNLLKHERVIETLMERHTLLPARFGTTFNEEPDLDRVLARHDDAIVEGLERVNGCVELGVRVMTHANEPAPQPAAAVASARPGHAYMLALAAEERRRKHAEARVTELSAQLHEPLANIANDSRLRPLLSSDLLLSAAYLVPRERVGTFRERVNKLTAAHPSVRILCTGPWPPYHFVPALGPVEAEHG